MLYLTIDDYFHFGDGKAISQQKRGIQGRLWLLWDGCDWNEVIFRAGIIRANRAGIIRAKMGGRFGDLFQCLSLIEKRDGESDC